MNKELEEAIKTLKELESNHFIRDKLERDCRCGGLKMCDIYKMIELNPAIETALKELERLQEENTKLKKSNEIYINSIQNIAPVLLEDYVEKDKIKEKIEELEKNRDMISGGYAISILEELLEGK